MARYELTDFEWKAIEPHLPNKPGGVPRVDDRRVLNGIFWVITDKCNPREISLRCAAFGKRGKRLRALMASEGWGSAHMNAARLGVRGLRSCGRELDSARIRRCRTRSIATSARSR